MSSGFTGDQATFVGFAIEALFHGAYGVLFGTALYVLLKPLSARRSSSRINHGYLNVPMLITTLVLFGLCATHFWLEFVNAYVRLEVHPGGSLSDEDNTLRAADTIFSLVDFLAQLVLVRTVCSSKRQRILIKPLRIDLQMLADVESSLPRYRLPTIACPHVLWYAHAHSHRSHI